MTIFHALLARLCRIFLLVSYWLAQGVYVLACYLEPAQPPPELPVMTSGPGISTLNSEGTIGTGRGSE